MEVWKMKEIEVKILEINEKEIVDQLLLLGARKTFSGDVKAIYFDYPNKQLSNSSQLLRLRKRGDVAELTHKKKISKDEAKICEEHEVIVADFNQMKEVLLALGFREFKQAEKKRISYELGEVHFEIDTYPDIPTFLEIEAPSVEELYNMMEKLGIQKEEAKPWGGKDLMQHYGKN